MAVPLPPPSSAMAAIVPTLGQTLVQTREVRVDVGGALPWAGGFALFGAGLLYAGVVMIQEAQAALGGVTMLLGAALVYAGWSQLSLQLEKRNMQRELAGLEVHYGLEEITVRRGGEVVETLALSEGRDHPLARWMPERLHRLLAMRALLVGRSADDSLRHAAEVGAWATFEAGGRKRKRRTSMLLVHEPSGAYRWLDPRRDEDDTVREWHDAGATVWRFDVEALPQDHDEERRAVDLGVTIALPTLVEP